MPVKTCERCGETTDVNNQFCVHCGEELEKENILQLPGAVDSGPDFQVVKLLEISLLKKILIVMSLLLVIAIGVFSIVQYSSSNRLYKTTIELLSEGRYSEANLLLDRLGNFKDSRLLRYQITYESLAFDCMNEMKDKLDSSLSYTLSDVIFYANSNESSYVPTCIIAYDAVDNDGSYVTMYALFIYENSTFRYNCHGITSSLNFDFPVISDDDILRSLITTAIRYAEITGKKTGDVNFERLMKLFVRNQIS